MMELYITYSDIILFRSPSETLILTVLPTTYTTFALHPSSVPHSDSGFLGKTPIIVPSQYLGQYPQVEP